MEVFEIITGKKLDVQLIYFGRLIEDVLDFKYTPFIEGMRETYTYYLIGKGLMKPGS